MTSSTTTNPGMNYVYQAPQILIPPQLPLVLKTYIKAAIRTQPRDLLAWSAYYFKCVHGGQVPPVKRHLEFPLFTTSPWSFTPGYLHVLINQLGREGLVPVPLLYEKWLGLTLNKSDLDRMLLLRHYPGGVMDIAELVAIAAGHLCKTLAATMTLVCELLTQEPEGGNARIPLALFGRLYRVLAELDCGPARQDEIVVQDIILPFGARESKLWSIPDGISPEIRDFIKKHFQSPQGPSFDILDEEEEPELESLTISSCVDVPRTCYEDPNEEFAKDRLTKSKKKKQSDVTLDMKDSKEGLQVWGDQCQHRGYPSESSLEEIVLDNTENLTYVINEKVLKDIPADENVKDVPEDEKVKDVPADEKVKDAPLDERMKDEPADEKVKYDGQGEKNVEELHGTGKVNDKELKIEQTEQNEFDMLSIPSLTSLPKMDPDTEDRMEFHQEDENSLSLSIPDLGPTGPVEFASLPVEGESLTKSEAESQSRVSFPSMGEILLRYHVPGIGPVIPAWQIEQVLDFMLDQAADQNHFVMPRNIRSRKCPPLDLMIEEPDTPEHSSYNSLMSRATKL